MSGACRSRPRSGRAPDECSEEGGEQGRQAERSQRHRPPRPRPRPRPKVRRAEAGERPGAGPAYLDTSALAKWYLPEPFSEEVEAFLRARGPAAIGSLTVVEMRSLLARRRREGALGERDEARVFACFLQDVRDGHLIRHPLDEALADDAVNLMAILADHPLRTLDALQLAFARRLGTATLATADRVVAGAGAALGLTVARFFKE